MKLKRTIPLLTLLVLAGVLTALAPAATSHNQASLVIRHQTRGCHAWSLDRGAFKASQIVYLQRGATIDVTNNDVMPHRLVVMSGPAVRFTRVSQGMEGAMGLKGTFPPAMLAHMGAESKITFTKPGLYHLTTKPGEDYMQGMKTVGPDNTLRLTVRVG
jgi:plastocyanin